MFGSTSVVHRSSAALANMAFWLRLRKVMWNRIPSLCKRNGPAVTAGPGGKGTSASRQRVLRALERGEGSPGFEDRQPAPSIGRIASRVADRDLHEVEGPGNHVERIGEVGSVSAVLYVHLRSKSVHPQDGLRWRSIALRHE